MIAPRRAERPGAPRGALEPPTQAEIDSCPFCEGREERTPPETLALAPPGRAPNTPGWSVRVVPNKFPAFERHEVVVHTPRHVRSVAELDGAELEAVAKTWRARRAAGPEGYLYAVVNEGREAGASLPHTHSQLIWLDDVPPAVREERDLRHLLSGEPVVERDGLVLLCPQASRLPYELLVAPVEPEEGAFTSELLAPALRLLGEAVRRLHIVEGAVPLNAWVHESPHWHIEVLPRLAVLASLELGAGIYINTLAPDEAARRLREAVTQPPARLQDQR